MAQYETDTMLVDEAVVTGMFDEIDTYLTDEAQASEWSTAFTDAQDYTREMYAAFTPELTPALREVGILLGGITLAYAEVQYGKDELTPKIYHGHHEDGLLASYHNAGHHRRFVHDLFTYAAARNSREPGTFNAAHYLRFPAIGGAHDAKMGNGRGNDERQSALFGARLMQKIGLTLDQDPLTQTAIEATTWTVATASQAVDPSKGFLAEQQAAAVADLLPMFDRRGPYVSLLLAPEIFMDQLHGQALTLEAQRSGFQLDEASVEACFAFFDENETAGRMFATYLEGLAAFYENFTPADLNLDSMFPGRSANIDFIRELNYGYKRGQISAREVLLAARDFIHAS